MESEWIDDTFIPDARTRWLSGEVLREQLRNRATDPALESELADHVGQTLDDCELVRRPMSLRSGGSLYG